MEHFYQKLGENWFTYPELYKEVVKKFDSGSHFVEVGTWKGRSAAFMAVEIINSKKQIRFDCVDSWEYLKTQKEIPKKDFKGLYETFMHNIKPVSHIVNPIKGISWEAAQLYEDNSLDFVFIDAAHDYDSVIKDLKAWYPKVKKGGIFAGHDYLWCYEVRMAVDSIIGKEKIKQKEGCWICEKR